LNYKYKYHLMLDESSSFRAVRRTDRVSLNSTTSPCTKPTCSSASAPAPTPVVDHERANSLSFVYSPAMPCSGCWRLVPQQNTGLRSTPSVFEDFQEIAEGREGDFRRMWRRPAVLRRLSSILLYKPLRRRRLRPRTPHLQASTASISNNKSRIRMRRSVCCKRWWRSVQLGGEVVEGAGVE
jgi:hypothetical protein